jgi:hypothetical protein
MNFNITCAALKATLLAIAGMLIVAAVTPAFAKSYHDAGSGLWDGYRNGVYEGRGRSRLRKSKVAKYTVQKKSKGKRYSALNQSLSDASEPRTSITGGGVRWVASAGCLNSSLRAVIYSVASSYGSVTVSSTCRSRGHNARVGGAHKSQHLTGNAVDFRVHGNVRGAYAYLAGAGRIGGFKHYGGGLFHIDTGPRRTW